MEQAHTRLISQLVERIAASDNAPLYLKFADTIKDAVRSGWLENGNILPGERDLSQLTGVSRITVRKALQLLEDEGVVTRSRGYGTQINNIFEYSLKEARGFTQQVVLRGKKPDTLWVNKRVVKCPEEVARSWQSRWAAMCLCSNAFAMLTRTRSRSKSPGCLRI
jgi:DNA-binding GntR family transcriptional regulator